MLAALVVLPCVLSGTAAWWWIGDLCVHFRMPYAIALSGLLVAYVATRRWKRALVISVVLGVNVSLLYPLFAARPLHPRLGEPLRLMTANVFIGNQHPQPILAAVRSQQPDVLLLMEIDDRWLSSLEDLNSRYPYRQVAIRDEGFAQHGPFGLALFSRYPLKETQIHRLGTAKTPVIETTLDIGTQRWTLFAAHPYPPVTAACSIARNTLLAELGELAGKVDGPTVVLGDLNITRWSPHFRGLLDAGGVSDSMLGFGYQASWPDIFPTPVIPIDHVLISPDLFVVARQIGPSIDSDHRPVIADLAVIQP